MSDSALSAPDPGLEQSRASSPARSVWVGASAGTGKTKVLTDRVLRLMLEGNPPQRILCITFTKAAAAEMSVRLSDTLARWATMEEQELRERLRDLTGESPGQAQLATARRLFAQVVDAPGGLNIQTIHAFCQSLLRRFPVEAGLPPHFDVIEDSSAAELLAAARDGVILDPSPEMQAALEEISLHVEDRGFGDLLRQITDNRETLRRALEEAGGGEALVRALYVWLGVEEADAEDAAIAAACADGAFDSDGLRDCAQALLAGTAARKKRGQAMVDWLSDTPEARIAGFEAWRATLLTQKGEPRKEFSAAAILKRCPDAAAIVASEAERLAALDARCRGIRLARGNSALIRVGAALLDAYEQAKRERGLLDYDDLILAAARLVSAPGRREWVLYKLDGGLDHLLVDEAQDTSPAQWAVVAPLVEEFFAGEGAREAGRTLFVVGDEKQSIFSFQGADPHAFARMRERFQRQIEPAAPWERVQLRTSFRSVEAVLGLVDRVFASEEAREGVVFAGDSWPAHYAWRQNQGGRIELWDPFGPASEGAPEEPWAPPLTPSARVAPASSLARAVAARIAGWLESGEILASTGRPIRAGDVMILVRTRSRLFRELVRALRQAGAPVGGVDRMVLTEELAVMDLLALIDFLLLPEDDLTLATVLKSPPIGLDETALFELAWNRGEGVSLWRALREKADDPRFAAAHDWLDALLDRADFDGPYALLASVLTQPCPADPGAGGSARRAIRARLDPEAEEPLDELLNQALFFESTEAPSLQRFLHWVRAGAAQIKREQEQGSADQVRILTVHGAKGLQAPIVILPDTMSRPQPRDTLFWPTEQEHPPLWVPKKAMATEPAERACAAAERRQDEEYRRLLYVALTRAEDRLVIAGCHNTAQPPDRPDLWYNLCRAGMERLGSTATRQPLAELLGPDWRGDALIHEATPAEAPVTMLSEGFDAATPPADEPRATLPAWALAPPPPEEDPPRRLAPSQPDEEEPPPASPIGPDGEARFRRGRLIHALLQALPECPPEDRPARAAAFLAQPVHQLSEAQQSAYAEEVLAVLDDPEFAPLFGPGSRAEAPLSALVGGRAIAGQVDRLLVTAETVTVLDYKTNRPPPLDAAQAPPVYLRQMAAYRAALRRIYPGKAIRCVLGWTDGPRLMPLPDALLDRHAP